MAEELGVHRNTVAKAYKSLADLGLIFSTPGRGTFAAARLELDNRRLHAQQISERTAEDILRARRSNISEDGLRQTIDEHIATIYRRAATRHSSSAMSKICVSPLQRFNSRAMPA